jgi:hypothetical protein
MWVVSTASIVSVFWKNVLQYVIYQMCANLSELLALLQL